MSPQEIVAAYDSVSLPDNAFVALPLLLSDVGLAAGAREEFTYTAQILSQKDLGDDIIEQTA